MGLALLATEARAQTESLGGCVGDGSAQDFEIGIRLMDTGDQLLIRVYDMADGSLVDARYAYGNVVPPGGGSCNWRAHYDNLCPGPYPNPDCVRIEPDRLYRLDIGTLRSYYYFNCFDAPEGTAFCPYGRVEAVPDVTFYVPPDGPGIRVVTSSLPNATTAGVDTWLPGGAWTLPYDAATICTRSGCNPDQDFGASGWVFLTPTPYTPNGPAAGTTIPLTGAVGADWRVPVGHTFTWSDTRVNRVRMGAGGAITVKGTLHASGWPMTALNASQGWLGVRYTAGSIGSLSSLTLSSVGNPEPEWAGSAVTIHNASPTLTDVIIQEPASPAVAGVTVTGASAQPVLTRLTATGLTDAGVYVAGDARVDIVRGGFSSNISGVLAAGNGSVAYLVPDWQDGTFRGPSITGNSVGVAASSSAEVRFGAPAPQYGLAEVSGNTGRGMTASSGGALYAGTATVYQRNRIFLNGGSNPTGNVLATGAGSRAYAQCNWWGPTLTDFRSGTAAGGTLALTAWLTSDPYVDASPFCTTASGSEKQGGTAAPEASLTGGPLTDQLLAALDAPTPASVAALAALIAEAPASEEAAAAVSEIGTLAARAGAPASARAALTAATHRAEASLRVAAWQALVSVRAAGGDASGALAATDALVAEGAVAQAEAARVYLHAAAGDSTAAVAALERLEAVAPGSVEAAVARASLGLGPDPFAAGRLAAAGEAVKQGEAAADVSLAVSPNPAASAAEVTLSLAEAAEVRLTVHDALGRAVATLAGGSLEAGVHWAEVPVGRLAPGVYVVRAEVRAADGTLAALPVARLTVIR